jgi:hypothetical protein
MRRYPSLMRRFFPSPDLLRARREAQQDPDADEGIYQERASELLGIAEENADRAMEELAIAQAHAFAVGWITRFGEKLYTYRAQKPLTCDQCKREIAPEELFTSLFLLPVALEWARCSTCRKIRAPGRTR